MDEYLDVEEGCVKGRPRQFVHRDMDGGRKEEVMRLSTSTHFLMHYICSLPFLTVKGDLVASSA